MIFYAVFVIYIMQSHVYQLDDLTVWAIRVQAIVFLFRMFALCLIVLARTFKIIKTPPLFRNCLRVSSDVFDLDISAKKTE